MPNSSYNKGDKVIFKKSEFDYYQTWHKREGFDYYLIAKVINHNHRKNKIGYKIILPDGTFIVHASASQLMHYLG